MLILDTTPVSPGGRRLDIPPARQAARPMPQRSHQTNKSKIKLFLKQCQSVARPPQYPIPPIRLASVAPSVAIVRRAPVIVAARRPHCASRRTRPEPLRAEYHFSSTVPQGRGELLLRNGGSVPGSGICRR